jgi:hypothetical protein
MAFELLPTMTVEQRGMRVLVFARVCVCELCVCGV